MTGRHMIGIYIDDIIQFRMFKSRMTTSEYGSKELSLRGIKSNVNSNMFRMKAAGLMSKSYANSKVLYVALYRTLHILGCWYFSIYFSRI